MPDDEAIWALLADRAASTQPHTERAGTSEFRRESKVRLVTAAIGVLTAARELVDVSEDILRQYRDRLASAAETVAPLSPDDKLHEQDRRKIDLTY